MPVFRKNDRLDQQIKKEEALIIKSEQEQNEAAEKLLELPADGRQCLTGLIEKSEVLTREIALAFICSIKVYNDKRIEIEWNFDDELVRMESLSGRRNSRSLKRKTVNIGKR